MRPFNTTSNIASFLQLLADMMPQRPGAQIKIITAALGVEPSQAQDLVQAERYRRSPYYNPFERELISILYREPSRSDTATSHTAVAAPDLQGKVTG